MTKRQVEKGCSKSADTADSRVKGAKARGESLSADHSRQLPTVPTDAEALGLEKWEPSVEPGSVSLETLLLRTLVDCNSDVIGGALDLLEQDLRLLASAATDATGEELVFAILRASYRVGTIAELQRRIRKGASHARG